VYSRKTHEISMPRKNSEPETMAEQSVRTTVLRQGQALSTSRPSSFVLYFSARTDSKLTKLITRDAAANVMLLETTPIGKQKLKDNGPGCTPRDRL
jgi:hypothetical protein